LNSRARTVAIAGLLCSVALVAILHVVRTDLQPVGHRLSEYANGPYGWMMTAAFVALGCGLAALGVLLRAGTGSGAVARAIPATALFAGAGMVLSGAFRTGESAASEVIHSRASGLATVAVVAMALAYSLPRSRRRTAATRDLVGAGLALTAAALATLSPFFHDTRWTGLSQRLLWTAAMIWLLWAAWLSPGETRLRSNIDPEPDQRWRRLVTFGRES
jgi:hypothetical protein